MRPRDVGWRCLLAIASWLMFTSIGASQPLDYFSQEAVVYQGVSIEPGDVIALHEGFFVTPAPGVHTPLSYGHTVLYLGHDSNRRPIFLDFQFRNLHLSGILSEPQAQPQFVTEEEFLVGSRNSHPSFDVFRLTDRSGLTRRSLIDAANRMASREWLVNRSGHVCSSAIGEVLSEATGQSIDLWHPNCLENPPFQRHPALRGRTINIDVAISEMRSRAAAQTQLAEQRRQQEREASERRLEPTRWRTLRTWADAACMYLSPPFRSHNDPVGAARTQEAVDRELRDLLLNYLVVLPEDRIRAYSASDRTLSSCHRQVLALILRAPGPLDARWLVAQLDQSKYQVDPLSRFLNSLGRALQDRSAAIVPNGPPTPESNAEPREPRDDRGDRRVGDNLGAAYSQLRGISLRGWGE